MTKKYSIIITLLLALTTSAFSQKTIDKKIYMHYMPWFETPESSGAWGWHWTMNNKNPEVIEADGQRQIASHYYPLIGPYASRDKDVIEYHFLLMKLSGIDGILIDWYGVLGSNGDINNLLQSSNAIVALTDDFDMEFGVILEDRFSESIDDVKANLGYLKNNYFPKDEYIKYGEGQKPLIGIFGPISFQNPSQWTEIINEVDVDMEFLTLWYESGDMGSNSSGEYMWIYQDDNSHIDHLTNFYNNRAPQLNTAMAIAYPGFNDYYAEGGAGESYFTIPHYYGSTLEETLDLIVGHQNNIDIIQLATFNDFGEGTIFEPTVETGFDYLNIIQQFTEVPYTKTELELVHLLYIYRKGYADNSEIQEKLDQASLHLRNFEIEQAKEILQTIDPLKSELIRTNKNEFEIFPNPVTGNSFRFTLKHPLQNQAHITLYNASGQQVKTLKIIPGSQAYTLDVSDLIPGIYVVHMQTKNKILQQKLIVE